MTHTCGKQTRRCLAAAPDGQAGLCRRVLCCMQRKWVMWPPPACMGHVCMCLAPWRFHHPHHPRNPGAQSACVSPRPSNSTLHTYIHALTPRDCFPYNMRLDLFLRRACPNVNTSVKYDVSRNFAVWVGCTYRPDPLPPICAPSASCRSTSLIPLSVQHSTQDLHPMSRNGCDGPSPTSLLSPPQPPRVSQPLHIFDYYVRQRRHATPSSPTQTGKTMPCPNEFRPSNSLRYALAHLASSLSQAA